MRTVVEVVAVVAVALAAVALAQNYSCFVHDYACADEGDSCIGDFHANGTQCDNESGCCAWPLHCINGTCEEDSRGKDCKSNADCHAAYYGTGIIVCIKNKCVVQGSFNDSCTKDDHCAGDQICVKGQCSGLNASAKCDMASGLSNFLSNFQCGSNLTCVNGECVVPLALGEKCTYDYECDVYSICNGGVCIERFSAKSNDTCHSNMTCESGLYCDFTEGKCKETVDRQYITCTKDEDCASYGNTSTCSECNAITGERFCKDPVDVEPDCIAEMAAAFKCYQKNGCAPTPSSSLDTCAQLECTAETNAIFTCQSRCENQKRVNGAKCIAGIMLRYCPLLPTWLRIVIAFSILLVIIVAVFIAYAIYRCCRKKPSDYKEVPSTPQ